MGKAIKHITIFGSGLMGCGIAQIFAADPSLNVTVYALSIAEANVAGNLRANLKPFIDKGIYTVQQAEAIIGNVHVTEDRREAMVQADLIIECVFEDMALKQSIFEEFEANCRPDTILASNTSVMSISAIGERVTGKDRVVGTHFWNPPYLIPLVEVVKTDDTSEATMEATMALLKKAGKHPIYVKKDVPGFVANRLQHALWREAISIVENGIADAATVDEAIKHGPGLRLPVLAPMENADMVGLDLTFAIHDYILKDLEDSHAPSPLLKEKIAAGELGFKSGKGFQEWTPETIGASRKRLSEYLIDALAAKKN